MDGGDSATDPDDPRRAAGAPLQPEDRGRRARIRQARGGRPFIAPPTLRAWIRSSLHELKGGKIWKRLGVYPRVTRGITRPEIYSIVNGYIGVDQGYLCDFTYRSHAEFYPFYCDLDIDPLRIEGTTRDRFIKILEDAEPRDQARILRGLLKKCPPSDVIERRSPAKAAEIERIAIRLEGGVVPAAKPQITSAVVERAIADAEELIAKNGATSGVDRLHTTLHGYVKAVCDEAGIGYPPEAGLNELFKLLKEQHPAFQNLGPRPAEIQQVLRSLGAVLAALNPVRNKASVAHPNPVLLDEAEALLVINAARTILHYLDAKLS